MEFYQKMIEKFPAQKQFLMDIDYSNKIFETLLVSEKKELDKINKINQNFTLPFDLNNNTSRLMQINRENVVGFFLSVFIIQFCMNNSIQFQTIGISIQILNFLILKLKCINEFELALFCISSFKIAYKVYSFS